MIQLKFRQFQTDSEDDSAMIQKGIFHEGAVDKSLYLPCIQQKNQNGVAYGYRLQQ